MARVGAQACDLLPAEQRVRNRDMTEGKGGKGRSSRGVQEKNGMGLVTDLDKRRLYSSIDVFIQRSASGLLWRYPECLKGQSSILRFAQNRT